MTRNYKKLPKATKRPGPSSLVLTQPQNGQGRLIGYARVSTEDQNLDMQISMLVARGVRNELYHLYQEKISAADARRPQFNLMVKMLWPGDTLIAYSFSRLFRAVKELLSFLDEMDAKDIRVESLTHPGLDLRTANGRMVVTMLASVDENERNTIRERTRHGMAELKRQGMQLGRPLVVSADDANTMKQLRKKGVSVPVIASKFNVSTSSVYNATR